jgi:hypothetical protein
MSAAISIGLGQVAATLALVAGAVALWERTELEGDIAVAAGRPRPTPAGRR